MALKNYKPVTASLRHRVIVKKPKTVIKLDRKLIKIKKKNAGRNNTGKITIRHRGSKSDHKRYLRKIDRARTLGRYTKCKVIDIQYDPNISGFLALLEPINVDKKHKAKFFILAPSNLELGSIIEGDKYKDIVNYTKNKERDPNINLINGINRRLVDLPIGSYIYNCRGIFARAAGTHCILLKTYNKILETENTEKVDKLEENVLTGISVVRLPSKKLINITSSSMASLGQVSNEDHNLTIKGKAGANRWIGRRPKVRGDAKNPVDHPMGGKTHGSGGKGKPKKTAWGKLARGQRKKNKTI